MLLPANVGDVQAGVRFAARTGLLLSVRGGGHALSGFGTNDDGGATWGHVATVLSPHGLAITSGDTKSVGVGGLTLSGGIGWQVRKYGLALDAVVAAEVDLVRDQARAGWSCAESSVFSRSRPLVSLMKNVLNAEMAASRAM